jgi:hypothetical protein
MGRENGAADQEQHDADGKRQRNRQGRQQQAEDCHDPAACQDEELLYRHLLFCRSGHHQET